MQSATFLPFIRARSVSRDGTNDNRLCFRSQLDLTYPHTECPLQSELTRHDLIRKARQDLWRLQAIDDVHATRTVQLRHAIGAEQDEPNFEQHTGVKGQIERAQAGARTLGFCVLRIDGDAEIGAEHRRVQALHRVPRKVCEIKPRDCRDL